MCKHLITYCKENYAILQVLLCKQLTQHKISLQQYMCLMEGTPTCGYEITLLILSQMFNIAILVIRSDFLWVSTQVPPRECPVVIIQNTSGEFLGTKSTPGVHPVSVGTVPKISVNKRRSPVFVKSSTPDDYSRKQVKEFDNMLKEKLSPIPGDDNNAECRSVDLNDSIDYKSVDEEITKSNTQLKTEISAADTPEKDNSSGEDESTITASKITDTDDEKSVTIPASMFTDGSTLVEKTEFPLPQFFPDSDDISIENNPSTSGEKNAREGISDKTKHDENTEITDNSATDGKDEKNEEITDNTMTDGKGEKKEEITDNSKTESAAVSKAVISGKSKQTKLHMENQNENGEDGNENDKTDGKPDVESGGTTSQNYDLSVNSPTIDPNDSEDSEDNEDLLLLSEIPTS